MNKTYKFTAGGIQCLFCDNISHNENDIRSLYCGYCKQFHAPLLLPIGIDHRPSGWDRVFNDSPDVGRPNCKCSHCAELIEKGVPVRFFLPTNQEYRYHPECLGMETSNDDYDVDFDDDLPY